MTEYLSFLLWSTLLTRSEAPEFFRSPVDKIHIAVEGLGGDENVNLHFHHAGSVVYWDYPSHPREFRRLEAHSCSSRHLAEPP